MAEVSDSLIGKTDPDREAFEKWLKNWIGWEPIFKDGNYLSIHVQECWITWQASRVALLAELEMKDVLK